MEAQQTVDLSPAEQRSERMLRLVRALVGDSRKSLMRLSRELGMPVSTLFEYMRDVRKHYAFTITPKDGIGVAELSLLDMQAAQPATNEIKREPEVVSNERQN